MEKIYAEISEVAVTPDGVIYVRAKHNGKPVGVDKEDHFLNHKVDNSSKPKPGLFDARIIKTGAPGSESQVKVMDNYAALIGSGKNRVVSTEEYGNFVVGKTVFTAHLEDIRIGGVYRLNGLMTSTMPSTIISPIPTLVLDIPFKDTLLTLAEITKDFTEMTLKGMI